MTISIGLMLKAIHGAPMDEAMLMGSMPIILTKMIIMVIPMMKMVRRMMIWRKS